MSVYSYQETETEMFNFVPEGSGAAGNDVPIPLTDYQGRYYIYYDKPMPDQPDALDLRPHDPTDPLLSEIKPLVVVDAEDAAPPFERELAYGRIGLASLDQVRQVAMREIRVHNQQLRIQAAETDDPVKLAEYADKAGLAERILAGAARDAEEMIAAEEGTDFSLSTAAEMAQLWREKAHQLREKRNQINRSERRAMTACQQCKTLDAILTLITDWRKENADKS